MNDDDLRTRIGDRVVVASVSGGKDSGAMSLYLTELGIEHIRVFADTGWEHRMTYDYIRGPLTRALGPIVEVSGPHTFQSLVRHKRIFPDRTKRFCTVELKVKPILNFIEGVRDKCGDVVNAIGVRREESKARSEVPEWEDSKQLSVEVWRPLCAWSEADVYDIHARHGLPLNPIYDMGAKRVGCWPCIHASQSEIVMVDNHDAARIEELDALETEVTEDARNRAEANGEELDWIRSMFSIRESKKKPDAKTGVPRRHHRPLQIRDAVTWARAGLARKAPEEPATSCGEWGFCES
jgi:3'-phosphoadenosine 5'-phosphosulfate sulfotransferase (PAPS reductase)/FAD synthetase